MKPYSLDLRERVIAALETGKLTQPAIAETYDVSLRTVETWARQWRETGNIKPKLHRSGPVRTLHASADVIRQAVAAQPDLTLEELCTRIATQTQVQASVSMMCRELQHLNLPRKKVLTRQPARHAAHSENASTFSRTNDGNPSALRRPPKIHR